MLYVNTADLTPDAVANLAGPSVLDELGPADTRTLTAARQELAAHVGELSGLELSVLFSGVVHTLLLTASWHEPFIALVAELATKHREREDAAYAAEDRERERAETAVQAWFRASAVSQALADEKWLRLTAENARKMRLRALAEAALGDDLELLDETRVRSLISQAVDLATSERSEVIALRTEQLKQKLPELAAQLAATEGYRGEKKHRERLARELLASTDPLARLATLTADIVRLADAARADDGPSPTPAPDPAGPRAPSLF